MAFITRQHQWGTLPAFQKVLWDSAAAFTKLMKPVCHLGEIKKLGSPVRPIPSMGKRNVCYELSSSYPKL
jgi:hypothetical protein